MSIDPLKSRIRALNQFTSRRTGKSIIYVMSRDMRVRDNHALLCAQKHAQEAGLPLAVVFVLKKVSQSRSKEHYLWMIEHLKTLESELATFDIPLMILIGDPKERLQGCVNHLRPEALYFDFSPLRGPRRLRESIAKSLEVVSYEVDTHNVVPAWLVSDKQEVGARSLRPKIHRVLPWYLVEPEQIRKHQISWPGRVQSVADLKEKIAEVVEDIPASGQADLQELYPVGEDAARRALQDFISHRLARYGEDRNDPTLDGLSGLSPYLHFGALSSLRVVMEASLSLNDPDDHSGYDTLVEEIIVRKELSDNFCYYSRDYRALDGAPQWAVNTLEKHAQDTREFMYSRQEFEDAKTHDPAWNAAQNQLRKVGKMHGYMRMYWAKKVLEWSESPEHAIQTLIYLNDFYSIDGGDPNGYTGIMWSVAGVHDRPWGERPIYGMVRSMVYGGLKRKFDISAYEQRWA